MTIHQIQTIKNSLIDKQKEICHKLVDKVSEGDLQKLLVLKWVNMNIIVKLMEDL